MREYRFHSTRHESLRMVERGLCLKNMKNVVKYPDRVVDLQCGRKGGRLKKFWKTVDLKTLAVVAEVKNNDCWIVTACYED